MSEPCLHCRLHETIQAHARETQDPRGDGRQPIDAPAVLRDLGAVVAEVIAGGEDASAVSAGLGHFMASLTYWLGQRGVQAEISFGDAPDQPDGARLH